MIIEFLHNHYDFFSRLAMSILHSLWQGALIFAVLQVILSQLKSSSASLRYSLLNLAMVALLSSFVLTFYLLGSGFQIFGANIDAHSSYALSVNGSELFLSFKSKGSVDYLMQWGVYLSVFWIVGVFVFLIKLLVDFYWAINLRSRGLSQVREDIVQMCDLLRKKIGLSKNIGIYESLYIDVPLVIGHIKPYILLPVGAVVHLSPLELESVILHELHHIKRNDYIANILLMLTEVVLFYHPVFWWLKKRINEERENRCDDVVISHVPPQSYAKALLKMEESRHQIRWAMALKDNNKFHLLRRIKRICMKSNHEFKIEVGRIVAALLLVGAFVMFAWADNEVSEESLHGEQTDVALMEVNELIKPSQSIALSHDMELPLKTDVFPEPDVSKTSNADTVPLSMPNIGDYIHAEISEELQRELEKYQEEMMKWQEEMLSEKEQMLQQKKLVMVQEMELQKTMQEMQQIQRELMAQEFQQKRVLQEETLRQTMDELKAMEKKMAEETLEKAKQQQQMMQVEMQKLQESLRESEEIRSKELKAKMKSIDEMHKVKEKEMKAKAELLKAREKELKKVDDAERLRMESLHEELKQLLSKEGYTRDFQDMNLEMDGDMLRLNQETLNRDLTEKCLQILKKYNFNLEGATWQIRKQK